MYDAVTRETYAQLFKMAEAKLPTSVRDAAVKTASEQKGDLVGEILKGLWKEPK